VKFSSGMLGASRSGSYSDSGLALKQDTCLALHTSLREKVRQLAALHSSPADLQQTATDFANYNGCNWYRNSLQLRV